MKKRITFGRKNTILVIIIIKNVTWNKHQVK